MLFSFTAYRLLVTWEEAKEWHLARKMSMPIIPKRSLPEQVEESRSTWKSAMNTEVTMVATIKWSAVINDCDTWLRLVSTLSESALDKLQANTQQQRSLYLRTSGPGCEIMVLVSFFAAVIIPCITAHIKNMHGYLWSPYGIGQTIIFSCCSLFFFFLA